LTDTIVGILLHGVVSAPEKTGSFNEQVPAAVHSD
jgi:hypothetical protein